MSTLDLFEHAGPGDEPDGPDPKKGPKIHQVAEINRAVRRAIESQYRDVWIEGELSDVRRAASGHVYFTLNDPSESAQLKGVMFRGDAGRAKAKLERGAVVRMRGQLTLYEARGSYQLVARLALPAGEGDLHAQFERIRAKLDAEGLFSETRKRPLPRLPRVVGVVTSAAGAALHDIIRVSKERCPVRIVVADCRVQGKEAPLSIVRALEAIQRLEELDLVIVGRGGGSAEDLWAFNAESVARAVANCRVPVVSAVGHEVDVTIADFVADVRASTPSNAAEIAVPDRVSLMRELEAHERRLSRALDGRMSQARLRLERLGRDLGDPRHGLAASKRALALRESAQNAAMRRLLSVARKRITDRATVISRHDPRTRLANGRKRHGALEARLGTALRPHLAERRESIARSAEALRHAVEVNAQRRRAALGRQVARLEAMSPLAVLSRGYAIALHGDDKSALTRAEDASVGDDVELVLHEGRLRARIEALLPSETDE